MVALRPAPKQCIVQNDHGVLHLPLGITLLVLAMVSISALGLMRRWRHLVELQLQLDRCVGVTALKLREKLNSLERSNQQIIILRATMLAASVTPPTRAATQTALNAMVIYQESLLMSWQAKRTEWLIRRGCSDASGLAVPLPSLPWTRDPPDALGPMPLRWPQSNSRELHVQLSKRPRHSAAQVEGNQDGTQIRWKATWTTPAIDLWASIH
jgi:hypothetical protein